MQRASSPLRAMIRYTIDQHKLQFREGLMNQDQIVKGSSTDQFVQKIHQVSMDKVQSRMHVKTVFAITALVDPQM
jgi:hypothetical protein